MSRKPTAAENAPLLHPRENADLYGHEKAEQVFLNRWQSGRMPHALLITGSKGIGKSTFAYRLARYILAGTPQPQDAAVSLFSDTPPAGLQMPADSAVFRRVMAQSHPDLLIVEPAFDERKGEYKKEILVEDTRKVAEFFSLTPAESQWRVVLIDSADEMNRNAANALLKILEEPPARAMLLLVSHNPGALLPTIRSRCQNFKLSPPGSAVFRDILIRMIPEIGENEIAHLACLSNHAPGMALELYHRQTLTHYQEMLDMLAQDTRQEAVLYQWAENTAMQLDWKTAEFIWRTLLERVVHIAAGRDIDELVDGERRALAALAGSRPLSWWLGIWEKSCQLLHDTAQLHFDRKQIWLTLAHGLRGVEFSVE